MLQKRRSVMASFLCSTLWASTGIFIRAIEGMSVPSLNEGRCVIAFFCSVLWWYTPSRAARWRCSEVEGGLVAVMTLYYVCASHAFYYAPVAMAALLIALAPFLLCRCVWLIRVCSCFRRFVGILLQ